MSKDIRPSGISSEVFQKMREEKEHLAENYKLVDKLDDLLKKLNECDLVCGTAKRERCVQELASFLTEETYHRLCDTPLRNTDTLGYCLEEIFACSPSNIMEYKERKANAFVFRLFNDWTLEIPSFDMYGARLYVTPYREKILGENFSVAVAEQDVQRVEKDIEKWERFCQCSDLEKACKIYKNSMPAQYKLMRYRIANLFGKYDVKVAKILQDCYKRKTECKRKWTEICDRTWQEIREQESAINFIKEVLFSWTSCIYIYNQEGRLCREERRA